MKLPFPVPLPLALIQAAFELAVHGHSADVLTVGLPVPPSGATVADEGDSVTAHETPDCVTLNVASPLLTLIVPTRWLGEVFVETVYPIVEGFEVPPPKLIVIQFTLLTADFKQFDGFPVMVNVPLLELEPAKAPVLLSVTDVQVCAYAPPQRKKSAATAARKLITSVKPRNPYQVAADLPTARLRAGTKPGTHHTSLIWGSSCCSPGSRICGGWSSSGTSW